MVCWSEANVTTSILTGRLARGSERARNRTRIQVVAIEVTECYDSVISSVKAKRAGGDEGIAGEALGRKRPERGCGCSEEGKRGEKEEE